MLPNFVQVYWFKDVEQRNEPRIRTIQTLKDCLSVVTATKPFCGHKGLPFRSEWLGFNWCTQSCDLMHDIKCACEMLLKGVVGKGQHGMYKSWNKDDKHRLECIKYGVFPDVQHGGLLPWRLTRENLRVVDRRILDMYWPHGTHRLGKNGYSFFIKSCRAWKSRDKMTIFMVLLPTCLRGFVPALHQAILQLVYALRRLEGQVLSFNQAKHVGVMTGSRVILKKAVPLLHKELLRGLVLLEGAMPVSLLNPALHHLVHYATQTEKLGSLRYFRFGLFLDYIYFIGITYFFRQ